MAGAGAGKRAGTRRATTKKKSRIDPTVLLLSLGIIVLVVAWGYLVQAAIDFGASGRDGEGTAWVFLASACIGAAGCLFIGLIMIAKLLALIGILPETATGPADSELAQQTARATPSTNVPTTDSYADILHSSEPTRTFDPIPAVDPVETTVQFERTFTPPQVPSAFAPPANPTDSSEQTGSHAAIRSESEEAEAPKPNPRYPGGKRAAR